MERFSYWDDKPVIKLSWDHEHYYGEHEHEYQPHRFDRGQYVYWSEDPGTEYQVTDFDPSDGQYMVNSQWVDPDDLSDDPDAFGGGHDPELHGEHLTENYPVGSKWYYNGHHVEIITHDAHDKNEDVQVRYLDGVGGPYWVRSRDLDPPSNAPKQSPSLNPDSPYAPLHVDPGESPNPRGFMPGDEVNYEHPTGTLPGVIKDPVHPFNKGEGVLNLDMHTEKGGHPPFPGYPPLDTTAPHDLIKQKYKHDRGEVNKDAEIPAGLLHPSQIIPIGATVYHGLSGMPLKVTDYIPDDGTYYGKPKYTTVGPDGQESRYTADDISDHFTPAEGQEYKYGDKLYYGGMPVTVEDYYGGKYTVNSPGMSPTNVPGDHLSHQPTVPDHAKHQIGDTVHYKGFPHNVIGAVPDKYDPSYKEPRYQLDPMGGMSTGIKDNIPESYILGHPDAKYPGQLYGKGDALYHWNGNPLEYKSYDPDNETYELYNPKTNETHNLGQKDFTDIPYTDTHTCKYCKGKGFQYSDCYTCHGTGVLPKDEANDQQDIFLTPQKGGGKCPTCEGTGSIEEECPYCHGTGNNWQDTPMPKQLIDPKTIEQNENKGLTQTCPTCHGYGDDPHTGAMCQTCQGKGKVMGPPKNSEPCPTCNGTDPNCSTCHGKGWHIPMPADAHACPGCNGTGQKKSGNGPCQYCMGRGWQSDEGCPRCGGSGQNAQGETCSLCNGSGKRRIPLTTTTHTDPTTGETITIKQAEAQSKGGNIPDSVIRSAGLGGGSSYNYRRPVGYNPVTKTMYVGPTGAIHGDFGRAISAPIQEGEYVENSANKYNSEDGQKGWHVGFVHNRPHGGFAEPGLGWYTDKVNYPKKFDKPANWQFLAQSLGENDLHKHEAPVGTPPVDTSGINLDDMDFDDL